MTTLSFYARGDGSSANNAALNVENTGQQPTVLITFDSGPTGDLVLEHNGGANDPDTTVTINGTSYNFKVELTGGLPTGNGKVLDPLEGKDITVISVVIGGSTERFFFVTDGGGTMSSMNQFGNGAISLSNANFSPPPVFISFLLWYENLHSRRLQEDRDASCRRSGSQRQGRGEADPLDRQERGPIR